MKTEYKNPILILLKDTEYAVGEAYVYRLEKKGVLGWAKYWFLRRIEKEGWEADEAYLVEESGKLPLSKWKEQEDRRQRKAEEEYQEEREKEEYERLKAKYDLPVKKG